MLDEGGDDVVDDVLREPGRKLSIKIRQRSAEGIRTKISQSLRGACTIVFLYIIVGDWVEMKNRAIRELSWRIGMSSTREFTSVTLVRNLPLRGQSAVIVYGFHSEIHQSLYSPATGHQERKA